ncbi:hypothetical protein [Frigoribacterium sp. CG_9.8]|uniref:hypothetical protein n=1 Tax=Frigoribacterium sp. CG_9.8 TaxID=2787733 RepID=UPI0018CAEE6E|nr:hypothetical protein [Frigoribacterium sp. CG_9.8]MBG6107233.1 hypothetical protein [Frigoribacterium sp. CG_9.8]
MATRWARFARGWIAAIVSLFVAACSHALAGGALPATAGLALCLAFSGVACVFLAGKTLSLARLSVAVALSQLLFHGLFRLLADAPPSTTVPTGAGIHHGDTMVLQLGTASSAFPVMNVNAELWMWTGHASGAIVTIAALSFGERTLWALVRLSHLYISRILDTVHPVETPIVVGSGQDHRAEVATACALIFSIHRLRGPPRCAIAR